MMDTIRQLVDSRSILYLSESEVAELGLFDFSRLCERVEDVYRLLWNKQVKMPKTEYLTYDGRSSYDRIIVLLGSIGGADPLSGVKLIGSSTGNRQMGLPRASGLVLLNDPLTQRPFCIMEGAQISAARTAAVTGVALTRLMPARVQKVGFIGCGLLALTHVRMWAQLFRDHDAELHFFDIDSKVSAELARSAETLGLKARIGSSAQSVVADADVILPATTATQPYIEADWIKADSLYSAISLLDPKLDVFRRSDCIVVDDLDTCKNEGRPLQILDGAGETERMRILSMGQIITDGMSLRTARAERILFNPMGTVITDLAVANMIFQRADSSNTGTRLPV